MKNFLDKILTLDNIHQWEERDSLIKESVSQHSFKVSAICAFLLESVFEDEANEGILTFKYLCLKYALLHDFDESILGRDIAHPLKYNNFNGEEIREVLTNFVDKTIKEADFHFVFENFENNKFISFKAVKKFVKLCDWIALYSFILRNKRLGCEEFKIEEEYCVRSIREKTVEVNNHLILRFDKQIKVENINKILVL